MATLRHIPHFINGRMVAGASGRVADVYDPNTGKVQAQVALASAAELDNAVQIALAAQPTWAATNPQRRARAMFEFKRLIEVHMDELAALLSSEHVVTQRWPKDGPVIDQSFVIPTLR